MIVLSKLVPDAISSLYADVSASGKLTDTDRYGLMTAILNEDDVSAEERQAIDRLLHLIYQRKLTVS